MAKPIEEEKVVIFTGAGISAESGLKTFRDSDGLWNNYAIEDVATPGAWAKDPRLVLEFYNYRRREAAAAQPNLAHQAVAALQEKYNVVVVTQNIDDLHERAGSGQVIHLHGELSKARSCSHPELIYDIGVRDIDLQSVCEHGSQLRPHIVWFGESVENMEEASRHLKTAARVLVVGTSLTVFPAAGLLKHCRNRAEKIIVSLDLDSRPFGFQWLRGLATDKVPYVVDRWMQGKMVV